MVYFTCIFNSNSTVSFLLVNYTIRLYVIFNVFCLFSMLIYSFSACFVLQTDLFNYITSSIQRQVRIKSSIQHQVRITSSIQHQVHITSSIQRQVRITSSIQHQVYITSSIQRQVRITSFLGPPLYCSLLYKYIYILGTCTSSFCPAVSLTVSSSVFNCVQSCL